MIASSRDADIARVLVDAHAAIDVSDSQGNVASNIALATGNVATASLLRRRQSMELIAYADGSLYCSPPIFPISGRLTIHCPIPRHWHGARASRTKPTMTTTLRAPCRHRPQFIACHYRLIHQHTRRCRRADCSRCYRRHDPPRARSVHAYWFKHIDALVFMGSNWLNRGRVGMRA